MVNIDHFSIDQQARMDHLMHFVEDQRRQLDIYYASHATMPSTNPSLHVKNAKRTPLDQSAFYQPAPPSMFSPPSHHYETRHEASASVSHHPYAASVSSHEHPLQQMAPAASAYHRQSVPNAHVQQNNASGAPHYRYATSIAPHRQQFAPSMPHQQHLGSETPQTYHSHLAQPSESRIPLVSAVEPRHSTSTCHQHRQRASAPASVSSKASKKGTSDNHSLIDNFRAPNVKASSILLKRAKGKARGVSSSFNKARSSLHGKLDQREQQMVHLVFSEDRCLGPTTPDSMNERPPRNTLVESGIDFANRRQTIHNPPPNRGSAYVEPVHTFQRPPTPSVQHNNTRMTRTHTRYHSISPPFANSMTAHAPSRHPDLHSIREEDEDPRSPWSALASVLGRVPAALNNANGTHPHPETPNRRVSSISGVPTMLQNQLPMDPPVTGPAMHRAIHQPTPRESIGRRKSHLPDALPHSRNVGAASPFMEPQWTSSRGLPPRQQPQHPQIASRNDETATRNGEYAGQTPFRHDTRPQYGNGTVLDAQRDHDDTPFVNHQPMPPSNRQSRRQALYPDSHMQLHRSDALAHHPSDRTPLQHRVSNGGASHRQPAPRHSLPAPSYTRQSAAILSHRVPSSHHRRVSPPMAPPDVNTDRSYSNLPRQSVQMRAPTPTVAPETANGIIHDPHAIAWSQPHSHNDAMARDVPFTRRTALESRNGSESDSLGFLWPETTLDNVASTIDARQQLGHVSNGVHTHDNTPIHPIEAHPWPSSLTEDIESNIVVNTTLNPLRQQKQPTQTSSYIVQSPHAHANIPPQLNPNRQSATNSLCFNETYDSPFASPSFYL